MVKAEKEIIGEFPLHEGYEDSDIITIEAQYFNGKFCCVAVSSRPEGEPNKRLRALTHNVVTWRKIIRLLAPALGMTASDFPCEPRPQLQEEEVSMLLRAVSKAYVAGKPFNKSGKNGLYQRRGELSDELKKMGRDRLELLADELLRAGRLTRNEQGNITVPAVPGIRS